MKNPKGLKKSFLYDRILAKQFYDVMVEKKGDWSLNDPTQALLLEILKEEQYRNDLTMRSRDN